MVEATGAGTVDRAVIGTVDRAAMAARIAGVEGLSRDRTRVVTSPRVSERGRHERERERAQELPQWPCAGREDGTG